MNKTTISMLLAALLPFAMVGCMAGPTTESEFDDDQAEMGDDAEESVGEAESALTVSDCCLRYDTLTSSQKIGCGLVVVQHCEANESVPACTKTASQGGGVWLYCPDTP